MWYSLCGKPDDVSSFSLMVAVDAGTLKDLESGEGSETKRISRISSWCMSSLFENPETVWNSVSESSFYYLTKSKIFSFCVLAYFQKCHQILACFYESKLLSETSCRVGQKRALQTWGKFCFPTGFSASFPDILFPHSNSSLRYDWVCEWLRVCTCECVSCVASNANAQKAGCAVLKAAVSVGAGEHRVSMITPENQGEGGRVFIWID